MRRFAGIPKATIHYVLVFGISLSRPIILLITSQPSYENITHCTCTSMIPGDMLSYATGIVNGQNNPCLVREHIRGYL